MSGLDTLAGILVVVIGAIGSSFFINLIASWYMDGHGATPADPERWFDAVKPGDMLSPQAMWNRTSSPRRQLASKTQVIEVIRGVNRIPRQQVVMFRVKSTAGEDMILSHGWFENPEAVKRAGR